MTNTKMTDSQKPSAACQVLNTPELLENIILHLPCKDVVASRRVSTLWRDTVHKSTKIRTFLGLAGTVEDSECACETQSFADIDTKNVEEHAKKHCATAASELTAVKFLAQLETDNRILVNPLMEMLFPYSPMYPNGFVVVEGVDGVLKTYEHPLLKEMFACQPPVKKVRLLVRETCDCTTDEESDKALSCPWKFQTIDSGRHRLRHKQCDMRNVHGITLQDFVNVFKKHCLSGGHTMHFSFRVAEDATQKAARVRHRARRLEPPQDRRSGLKSAIL